MIWGEQGLRDALKNGNSLERDAVERLVEELDALRAKVKTTGVPVEDALALQREVGLPLSSTFAEVVREAVRSLPLLREQAARAAFREGKVKRIGDDS